MVVVQEEDVGVCPAHAADTWKVEAVQLGDFVDGYFLHEDGGGVCTPPSVFFA